MRPAPRAIDKATMPSVAEAAKMIQRTVNRPWPRLEDTSIGELVETCGDGTPAWLTGSMVWLTAVFGMPPDVNGDFDVVFSTKESAAKFVHGAVCVLNGLLPQGHKKFEASTNALGGSRIVHPDGKHVIDAWCLGDNESISELIMAYPGGVHNRCAYYLSRTPSPGCLFRIVTVNEEKERMDNSSYAGKKPAAPSLLGSLLSGISRARSSYPGDID